MADHLEIWTIYQHPSDYPDQYVARKTIASADKHVMTNDMFTADSLDEIRALLPPALMRIPRYASDDPVIVECWL
jgi:hypothetical protein